MQTWDEVCPSPYQKYYRDGFRNGWLDASFGHSSRIALTYPDYALPGYATGYYDGQRACKERSSAC